MSDETKSWAQRHRVSPEHLMKLGEALESLPNVKPRKARATLDEFWNRLVNALMDGKEGRIELPDGSAFGWPEFNEIFVEDIYRTRRVTPPGAEFLVRLYRAGVFELKSARDEIGEPRVLLDYAANEAAILQKQAAEDAEIARRKDLVAHPEKVTESEFTYGLLNEIFFKHCGEGSHELEIGGIKVVKSLGGGYRSNSGKNRDFDVSFSWTGSDGKQHSIDKQSRYKDNRRNDPVRNHGLPE